MEQSGRCPLGFLFEALNVTTLCESGYKASVNPRLHIEFALMKLSFMLHKPGMQAAEPAPAVVSAPAAPASAAPAPAVSAPAEEAKPVRRKRFVSSNAPAPAETPVSEAPVAEASAPVETPVPEAPVAEESAPVEAPAPAVPEAAGPVPEKAPARRGRRKAAVVNPTWSIDNM